MQSEEPGNILRVWAVPVRLFLGAMWIWASLGSGGTVIPDRSSYGPAAIIIGVILGLLLLLGLATRLAALTGAVLLLIYWIGPGYADWPFTYLVLTASHLFLIPTYAGRSLGIDTYLSEKNPRSLVW